MVRPTIAERLARHCRIERFEEKLALTADALFEPQVVAQVMPHEIAPQVETSSTSGSATDLATIREQYQFDGRGQTVAVIDSGIAWDHYALGGGFGAGHRVVGGWDFAENDANPYDDGPAGFHGTHVSGIIGSSDSKYTGVAPGADLVGLRVFNDQGAGNLEWVSQALQWVHDNRNSFENPITTVNLSLGSDWNATTLPGWATLESKLAQLKADGIFISVAAGNAFQNYRAVGLSYPAVSSHVVPVASHGADGDLSDFSQRSNRVLVAPGEAIKSTVPNHLFGGTQTNQFLGASGTSMAAPYVAGVSMLLRDAYEFMGQSWVTQDQLYSVLSQTADRVWDAATNAWYNHVNVAEALGAVIPDNQGGNWNQGQALGYLQNGQQISGIIGTVGDVDVFAFTAETTGRVTLTFQSSHDLLPLVKLYGGQANWSGNQLTLDVVAGQRYQFSVETGDGTGHYQINTKITSGIQATDWGRTFLTEKAGVALSGTSLFRLTAGRDGQLTVLASMQSGQSQFALLDENQRVIANPTQTFDGQWRLDTTLEEGDVVFLRAIGQGVANFRAANLVNLDAGQLTVHGTHGNDSVTVTVGEQYRVSVNQFNYQFHQSQVSRVQLNGHQGFDQVQVNLSNLDDQIRLSSQSLQISNSAMQMAGGLFEVISIDAAGGLNRTQIQGSQQNDSLLVAPRYVTGQVGSGHILVTQTTEVTAWGQGGTDLIRFLDSHGADQFSRFSDRAQMQGVDFVHVGIGFEQMEATSRFGSDSAQLVDSQWVDQVAMYAEQTSMSNQNWTVTVRGFDRVNAVSQTGGQDQVALYGSAGNDQVGDDGVGLTLTAASGEVNRAVGFSTTQVFGRGGIDSAVLVGTSLSEKLVANDRWTQLQSGSRTVTLNGILRTEFDGRGGVDELIFSEFGQGDELLGNQQQATARYAYREITARGFEFLEAKTKSASSSQYELQAVDYLFMLDGQWQAKR